MTDIENEAEIIPKKLSFTSTISENRSRTASFVENLPVDFQTSVSPVIPAVIHEIAENNEDIPLFSVRQIYKNLIILSLALLVFITAYIGILALQSSLNTKGNVGVNSLIVMHAFVLVSTSNNI
jgi:hypothetical protein